MWTIRQTSHNRWAFLGLSCKMINESHAIVYYCHKTTTAVTVIRKLLSMTPLIMGIKIYQRMSQKYATRWCFYSRRNCHGILWRSEVNKYSHRNRAYTTQSTVCKQGAREGNNKYATRIEMGNHFPKLKCNMRGTTELPFPLPYQSKYV